MTLKQRLSEDLKNAMRSGDTVKRSVIRLALAGIQNEEIAQGKELSDDAITGVLTSMSRRYHESIDQYGQGGRIDLVVNEEAELAVLIEYLPQQLSRDEVRSIVAQVVQEVGASGPSDKGKVMGRLMPQLRGKADGGMVNSVVTEVLESQAGVRD